MRLFFLMFFCLLSWSSVNAQILTDSLIFLYNYSGNSNDSSGNGIDSFVHGATLISDRFGQSDGAYYFDGVDDFIDIPASPLI